MKIVKNKKIKNGSTEIIIIDKIKGIFKKVNLDKIKFWLDGKKLYVYADKKTDWRQLGFDLANYLSKFDTDFHIKLPKNNKEFVEGVILGSYEYSKKSDKKKSNSKLNLIGLINKKGSKAAEAQNFVRDLVNSPPNEINSITLKDLILEEFHMKDTKFKIYTDFYEEFEMADLGMNGHLAVNAASENPALTIKLSFKPENPKRKIVLVGKGLTYDSGGLDIKTHMETMKLDKSGAMTLIGLMKYISECGSENEIICYLGIAENMVDSRSYRADDIITMMNGKTVEVKNTDAEGRLVLFDNLTLAEKENKDADEFHSLATLTGAAINAFGAEVAPLVGFNDKLKKKIIKSGKKVDEIFINAEFHKYMMDGVNGSITDLVNTGTPTMGCQKAGLFLTNALTKKGRKKYVHWDIAGPAFAESPFGTNKKGGTGFGVRTLIELFS